MESADVMGALGMTWTRACVCLAHPPVPVTQCHRLAVWPWAGYLPLCFRLTFCKTKLTLGLWEGSEETEKGPGVRLCRHPSCPWSIWDMRTDTWGSPGFPSHQEEGLSILETVTIIKGDS